MSSIWGRNFKISVFGESHGVAVGIVIDNLPSGLAIDFDKVRRHMARRAPGQNEWSTPRKEDDEFNILSGWYNGRTTGTPLCIAIPGKDRRSEDYDNLHLLPRPGHADYTGHVRYGGFEDRRGGGHFSGRLTSNLVLAGSIARQILAQKGIQIVAHIKRLACIDDTPFDKTNIKDILFDEIVEKEFPVINDEIGIKMQEAIAAAKADDDSVGGIIECAAVGVSAGIGSPIFESVESILASMLFSVPAVKGVEFGSGFEISDMRGSQSNDEIIMTYNGIGTKTNHNGGIIGGITNSMPIIASVAIKPTASIGKVQNTVNLRTGEEQKLKVEGRHDPCIVPRAVPVIESAMAIALLDCLMERATRRI